MVSEVPAEVNVLLGEVGVPGEDVVVLEDEVCEALCVEEVDEEGAAPLLMAHLTMADWLNSRSTNGSEQVLLQFLIVQKFLFLW